MEITSRHPPSSRNQHNEKTTASLGIIIKKYNTRPRKQSSTPTEHDTALIIVSPKSNYNKWKLQAVPPQSLRHQHNEENHSIVGDYNNQYNTWPRKQSRTPTEHDIALIIVSPKSNYIK